MKAPLQHTGVLGTACAALLIGSSSSPASLARHSTAAVPVAPPAVEETVTGGENWVKAAQAAFDDALEIDVPFAELTNPAGGAEVLAFDALAGQTLEIAVAPTDAPTDAGGAVFVEVFRVVDVLGEGLRERLTALKPGTSSLRTRLPSDGTYQVLVQAEPEVTASRRFTLELGAALPFPVVGARADAIRSLFGATRDAGQRHHQGVDIFVQRLTPVLAVAAGRAMPARDNLGGNTVWLNTAGTSYYYAHLDRVAVREQQFVKVGDVLGYVGNTGNARNVASHLHFGVYRWGKEPVDPLPLLVGRRFAKPAAALATDAGG
jgi:murein DD-endopeptidase MepM/ murein hydrolase activator NlpD